MRWLRHPPYRSRSRRAIRFLRRRVRTTAPILSAPRHRNPRHPSRGNSRDLDPAILRLIATKEGLSSTEVEALLNTQCGLLGISGVTNDMKVLLQAGSPFASSAVILSRGGMRSSRALRAGGSAAWLAR